MKLLFIMILPCFLAGCSMLSVPEMPEELNAANLKLNEDGAELHQYADIIDKASKTVVVKQTAAKVAMVGDRLLKKDVTANAMKTTIDSLKKQVAKLNSDKDNALNWIWTGMIIVGLVGVVLGIAIIIVSKMALAEVGTAIAVVGGCVAALGLAFYYFAIWLAYIGGIGLAITLVSVIIMLWRKTGLVEEMGLNFGAIDKLSNRAQKLINKKSATAPTNNQADTTTQEAST